MKTKQIVLAVTLGVLGWLLLSTGSKYMHEQAAEETSSTVTTAPMSRALAVCTGLPTDPATEAISYANCLGKLRGFVDAHNILVELAKVDPDSKSNIELWCVSKDVTDQELLDSVFKWVENNETRLYELVTMYSEPNATAAVMIASLHDAYPCAKDLK